MLSTHVLDVSRGVPAAGIEVTLHRLSGGDRSFVARSETDKDGRIDDFTGDPLQPGTYELVFAVAAYFTRTATASLYDEIPVRLRIDSSSVKYHVPLLLAPYGYSTYRGS